VFKGVRDEPPFKPTPEAKEVFSWAAGINKPDKWLRGYGDGRDKVSNPPSKESVVARNKAFEDFRDKEAPRSKVMNFPRSPVDQADELARRELNEYRRKQKEKGNTWLGPM
jgi:hypothetical protein